MFFGILCFSLILYIFLHPGIVKYKTWLAQPQMNLVEENSRHESGYLVSIQSWADKSHPLWWWDLMPGTVELFICVNSFSLHEQSYEVGAVRTFILQNRHNRSEVICQGHTASCEARMSDPKVMLWATKPPQSSEKRNWYTWRNERKKCHQWSSFYVIGILHVINLVAKQHWEFGVLHTGGTGKDNIMVWRSWITWPRIHGQWR